MQVDKELDCSQNSLTKGSPYKRFGNQQYAFKGMHIQQMQVDASRDADDTNSMKKSKNQSSCGPFPVSRQNSK